MWVPLLFVFCITGTNAIFLPASKAARQNSSKVENVTKSRSTYTAHVFNPFQHNYQDQELLQICVDQKVKIWYHFNLHCDNFSPINNELMNDWLNEWMYVCIWINWIILPFPIFFTMEIIFVPYTNLATIDPLHNIS